MIVDRIEIDHATRVKLLELHNGINEVAFACYEGFNNTSLRILSANIVVGRDGQRELSHSWILSVTNRGTLDVSPGNPQMNITFSIKVSTQVVELLHRQTPRVEGRGEQATPSLCFW